MEMPERWKIERKNIKGQENIEKGNNEGKGETREENKLDVKINKMGETSLASS